LGKVIIVRFVPLKKIEQDRSRGLIMLADLIRYFAKVSAARSNVSLDTIDA
jgi:hypothetical protein